MQIFLIFWTVKLNRF